MLDKLVKTARETGAPVFTIAEAYNDDIKTVRVNPANLCNNLYSVSKNFTATAIGILIDRERLSLSTDMQTLFGGEYELPDGWKRVTVENVLTQTAGISHGFLDIDVEDISEYPTTDFLRIVFDAKLDYEPGVHFCYSDSNYYLASRIVSKAGGKELSDFLREELFTPAGFQGPAWAVCPNGFAMGATGLFCSTADMIKLGMIYADGGIWKGRRIVSQSWVDAATRPHIDTGGAKYGYSFWMSGGERYYTCGGMFDQQIFISRSGRHVIAWQAYDDKGAMKGLHEIMEADFN